VIQVVVVEASSEMADRFIVDSEGSNDSLIFLPHLRTTGAMRGYQTFLLPFLFHHLI
jgi:hypothetical protein